MILSLLVLNLNSNAIFKACVGSDFEHLGKNAELVYIDQNIYRVPKLLKVDISKTTKYRNNHSYQNDTKKYRQALLRGVFPDLCVRFIGQHVGYGLFANEKIVKGQLIGEYVGEIVFFTSMTNTDYSFEMPIKVDGKTVSIDSRVYGNELRFTNHSDHPNVATNYIVVDGRYRLIFYAKQDILPGQQLFIDYGKAYWTGTRKKMNLEQ